MRFYTKITLLIIGAGLLPLMLVGIITMTSVENHIESTADAALNALAEEVAKGVWRPIDEGYQNLLLLSRNPLLRTGEADLDELHTELVNTRNYNRIFSDISLVNPEGQIRTSVYYSFRKEWTNTSWFQSALRGVNSISEHDAPENQKGPLYIAAVAVSDEKENVIGVLVATYDLPRIRSVIESVSVENGKDLLEWILLIRQPKGTVYAPVFRARYALFITAGGCLGIINILAFFLTHRIRGRVGRLVRFARELGEGKFPEKLENYGNDEIGELGRTLNWASEELALAGRKNKDVDESLKRSFDELESRVRKRTTQLAHEVLERRRAEQLSMNAKREAERANRAKSEFLANMSHELRTPLNHIIGFTEMIVDRKFGFLNEAQEEVLEDVLQSSKHLLSLINDILDLSKVEAGKLEFNPSPVDLKTLLENSLTMVKEKALKHGLTVTTDIGNIPESFTADERKLKQIMYNLLSNAVKFTPDGGKIVVTAGCIETVETEAAGNGNCIQLSVSDTGIGLKSEDLQRIFEPFEQVGNVAQNTGEGTGLGLALTRRLVELHGGRIWAESKGEGAGATFYVTLPVDHRPSHG